VKYTELLRKTIVLATKQNRGALILELLEALRLIEQQRVIADFEV